MARKSLVFLAVGMVMFFFASVSSADVPDSINYQGKLTTASGGCLNDTVQMTFAIYADESSTDPEWSETQTAVEVKEGIFNVLLGSVNPLPASIFDGTAKYLGVQVESDPEMSPLKPMVTTAYAFGSHHAQEADTADYARDAPTASDGDWEFSGDDIYRLDGNVGIGTDGPAAKLHITGGELQINTDQVGGYYSRIDGNEITGGMIGPPGTHHLHIKPGDNSSYLLLAEDGGNVGIGTTSPGVELHVEGEAMSVIASDTFYMVPKRGIIMWSGLLADIPVGWALCDGANGTPDLRDRFIYGCSVGENPGATGGNTSHNHSVDIPHFLSGLPSAVFRVGLGASLWVAEDDHRHGIDPPNTETTTANHLPPYYKLAFIMKL